MAASSPNDVDMIEDDSLLRKSFTVEENIEQLQEIDSHAVRLMSHVSDALQALTVTSHSELASGGTAGGQVDGVKAQKDAFQDSADAFLTTLHTIDVKMKRQIMGLDEAGIIDLSHKRQQDPKGKPSGSSLKPNGAGAVGNLDVGWLNSRGSRVERDMEAELWQKARDFLSQKGSELKSP